MDFRTELALKPSLWKIDLKDPIVTIGSCFSDSIGSRFYESKFPASVNPFGTTYHPISIHKLLQFASFPDYPSKGSYLEKAGVSFNYNFHSEFHDAAQARLEEKIRQSILACHNFLKTTKVLILTYGTAWIFERTDTGESVANCHKVSSSFFTKRLASTEEIVGSFKRTHAALTSINPDLKIILTVSPVRHIKDTIPLNSAGKAVLRVACHQISQECEGVEYFPAFEIMMDDLRDYRFYKDDLLHPSDAAEKYIWEKFSSCYFNDKTSDFVRRWEELSKAIHHKPFNPSTVAHQKFLRDILTRLDELRSVANVENEIASIKSRVIDV